MNDVVDLVPLIRRKRSSTCEHLHCEVDDTIASCSCTDCGAELDPWWFLRALAARDESERRQLQKQHDDHVAWVNSANATIERLNREIRELTAAKNRLWNEQLNGEPLGSIARRSRRRRAR